MGAKFPCLRRSDAVLAFRWGEGMDDFGREDVGSQKLMNSVLEVISEKESLVGQVLCQDPFHGDIGVKNVDHSWSRSSRMAGTAMSRSPCFRKISSRMRLPSS